MLPKSASSLQWIFRIAGVSVALGGTALILPFALESCEHAREMTEHHRLLSERRDEKLLTVLSFRCASVGIILLVRSASGVAEVRAPPSTFSSRGLPVKIAHRSFKTKLPGYSLVLVPLPFSAGREFYLDLYSQDGHWYSISPYFGLRPDCPDDQWKAVWSLPYDSVVGHSSFFPTESIGFTCRQKASTSSPLPSTSVP